MNHLLNTTITTSFGGLTVRRNVIDRRQTGFVMPIGQRYFLTKFTGYFKCLNMFVVTL